MLGLHLDGSARQHAIMRLGTRLSGRARLRLISTYRDADALSVAVVSAVPSRGRVLFITIDATSSS